MAEGGRAAGSLANPATTMSDRAFGDGIVALVRRLGRLVQLHVDQLCEIVSLERQAAAQHFVSDGGEAVDVGAIVDFKALALLGSHVSGSAEEGADGGFESGRRGDQAGCLGVLDGHGHGLAHHHDRLLLIAAGGGRARGRGKTVGDLGDAEIEDFDVVPAPAIGLEPDVAGLEIAVDDAGGARGVEGEGRLLNDVEDEVEGRARLLTEVTGKGLAVEVFHHHVGHFAGAGVGHSEIGDVDDVGMAQAAGGFGFALEPLQELFLSGEGGHDHLEGNRAHCTDVSGAEDRAHGSFAELALDPVFLIEDGAGKGFELHSVLV